MTTPQNPEPLDRLAPRRRSAWPCLSVLLALGAVGVALLIISILSPGWIGIIGLRPDRSEFGVYTVNPNFTRISDPSGHDWKIDYEKTFSSRFSGKVRHISPIQIADFPILTHDILVTTQDFADPQKVTTSVSDHHFIWVALTKKPPSGSINLLHTVPKDDLIFRQLSSIKPGDQVTISGWEITRINVLQADGTSNRWWEDAGCNTLMVDSVSIDSQP